MLEPAAHIKNCARKGATIPIIPTIPDIPDNPRFKSPRRYKFPLYKQQKFNKLLMIQIAIFATIPVKAKRARPRAAFHQDLPGAQKFKTDPEQNPRALKAFKSSRKKSSFQLFLQNKINSRKREKRFFGPAPPATYLDHEMSYPDVGISAAD